MNYLFTLLMLAMAVSACAPQPMTKTSRPSKYAEHHKSVGFSGWYIENCRIVMRVSDMNISSDGKTNSTGKLDFKIRTNIALLTLPRLSFNTIGWTPAAIGNGQNFSFEMPYNSTVAMEMKNDYAYLIITYQTPDSRALKQHFFKLDGIPQALAYVQGQCG